MCFPYFRFLRSVMISFKCGLVLWRYSSTDSVLFLSLLLSYSRKLLLQKLPTITGFEWPSFSSISKRFLITLIIQSLIALSSYFSLKRFLMFLIVLSSIPFSGLNRFLPSLIVLIILVVIFFKYWTFHHYMLWKKLMIFYKRSLLCSLKERLKI